MARRTHAYHHGALRRALVVAATELVLETGVADVSLRAVARRAGVSHAAAYHHFVDRRALLSAVAAAGLVSLTAAMRRGANRARAQPAALRAMGGAYVRFALAKPALYRLMFGAGIDRDDAYRARQAAADGTFRALVEEVEACQELGVVRSGAAVDLALSAWAAVHGVASLLLDDQLSFPGLLGRSPRSLVDAVLTGYFVGARAPADVGRSRGPLSASPRGRRSRATPPPPRGPSPSR